MPLTDKKPRGILRLGLRLPIFMYRLGLGGIFGKRFLLLEHTGRKSGRKYQTVIEVVRYDKSTGAYYVASGWGELADWYLNLKTNPGAMIMVGRQMLCVQSQFLTEEESAWELIDYAKRYPLAFKELSYLITGKHLNPTVEACRQFARSVPIVRLLQVPREISQA
jgi:deazaflavin-dependent oxidoreductase (nitroreductase family)